ncbi:uncharacterized protein [Drosophila pseudoobscura]|uniref:Secreted protein n=1 Tax=Drosophila pseudoobscura pseudoobscura TaxID=46245 RepID=A0A6I8V646_DROPS|nr:uncharacterized protein LOC13036270 [Drosophila pseudoobscura]
MIFKFDLLTLLSISNMIWNAICVDKAQLESVQCGDCKKTQSGCPRVESPGIYCENIADQEKIRPKEKHSNRAADNGLFSACVPDNYEQIGEIWDWCCFWNAEIGCQQLRGRFYNQNSSWNEDETCDLCLQSCDCHSKDHVSRNRLSRVLVLCLTIIRIY